MLVNFSNNYKQVEVNVFFLKNFEDCNKKKVSHLGLVQLLPAFLTPTALSGQNNILSTFLNISYHLVYGYEKKNLWKAYERNQVIPSSLSAICPVAEALYVTCKLQNCTDANKGKPFPGYIDPNSLVVQDEYVFVQVSNLWRGLVPLTSNKYWNDV